MHGFISDFDCPKYFLSDSEVQSNKVIKTLINVWFVECVLHNITQAKDIILA